MASLTLISQIVDYYVNLLIIQYNQLLKAQQTIALYVSELLASGIIFDVRDGYDLDSAIGIQLDILAKYIGVNRFYTELNLDGYFSFILYDDGDEIYSSEIGFCDYTDYGEKPGLWLTYDDIVSGTLALSDSDFRTLLKLKILQNNSNHSNKQIDDNIFTLFGTGLIPIDNYDMTMNYQITNTSLTTIITVAAQKGLLPKPMGVELILQTIDVLTTEDGTPIITDNGDYIIAG